MSKADLVAKLETLLARVRTRAAEPRVAAVALPVAAVSPPRQPPPPEPIVAVAPPPPVSPVVAPPAPPLAVPVVPSRAPEVQEAEVMVRHTVEVSVNEVPPEALAAAAPEPSAVAENAESRERLIVAAPLPEPSLDGPLELDEPIAAQPATMVKAEAESPGSSEVEVVLEEPVEEAPVSSRRAVVVEPQERLAEMAFGTEEPAPRHTPPPESGRLPAPPEEDAEADITGVREASSLPLSLPQPAARSLSAERATAQLQPNDAVAQVIGAAQSFAPASFLELLDASLAL